MRARGTVFGLTRGAGRCHFIRAGLESIAYQTADVLRAHGTGRRRASQRPARRRRRVGNDFLMQFQADILDRAIVRPRCLETTALGAAGSRPQVRAGHGAAGAPEPFEGLGEGRFPRRQLDRGLIEE